MKNLRRFLAVIIMAAVITAFMPYMGDIAGSSDYQASAAVSTKTIKGIQNTTIHATANASVGVISSICIEFMRSAGYKVDYYEVFRSEKKNSGYGTKAYAKFVYSAVVSKLHGVEDLSSTRKAGQLGNIEDQNVTEGTTYYYKVRGVRKISGKKYYTKWSNKVSAKAPKPQPVYKNKDDDEDEDDEKTKEEIIQDNINANKKRVAWIETQTVIDTGTMEGDGGFNYWVYEDTEGKRWAFLWYEDEYQTTREYEVLPKYDEDKWNQEMLELVNAEREKAGVAPLKLNHELCKVAKTRALECQTLTSHTRPDGRTFNTAIYDAGLTYSVLAGENLSTGAKTPAEAVTRWMNSPGHKANILNESFTEVGFGISWRTYTNGYVAIQNFIG